MKQKTKAMSFAKAGKMAKQKKDKLPADLPFFIDDNVSVTVLTGAPSSKKIMGFEARWKQEPAVKFMVQKEKQNLTIDDAGRATFYHPTILAAFKAMEGFFNAKK